MIYYCNNCGSNVETTMKFCNSCGASLMNNTTMLNGYEERIADEAERKILFVLKRDLEKRYPNIKFSVKKTCESYTTLFADKTYSIIRLERLIQAVDIWFRLSQKKREEYRFKNKFHWYNEKDSFWGITTRINDFDEFNEFIDDAVNDFIETEKRLKEKQKEKLAKK